MFSASFAAAASPAAASRSLVRTTGCACWPESAQSIRWVSRLKNEVSRAPIERDLPSIASDIHRRCRYSGSRMGLFRGVRKIDPSTASSIFLQGGIPE